MNRLEKELRALPEATPSACCRIIARHAPEDATPQDWAALLRRIADYIEQKPVFVEIAPETLTRMILTMKEG